MLGGERIAHLPMLDQLSVDIQITVCNQGLRDRLIIHTQSGQVNTLQYDQLSITSTTIMIDRDNDVASVVVKVQEVSDCGLTFTLKQIRQIQHIALRHVEIDYRIHRRGIYRTLVAKIPDKDIRLLCTKHDIITRAAAGQNDNSWIFIVKQDEITERLAAWPNTAPN